VIALDDLGAFAALSLQLKRRLEEVHAKARGCIETRKQWAVSMPSMRP